MGNGWKKKLLAGLAGFTGLAGVGVGGLAVTTGAAGTGLVGVGGRTGVVGRGVGEGEGDASLGTLDGSGKLKGWNTEGFPLGVGLSDGVGDGLGAAAVVLVG